MRQALKVPEDLKEEQVPKEHKEQPGMLVMWDQLVLKALKVRKEPQDKQVV